MTYLFFILQILFFGPYQPTEKPEKPLSQLSINEVNKLFDEQNKKFKEEALNDELKLLCETLNGSVLLAFGDKIFFRKDVGYKKLAQKSSAGKINEETLFDLASISKQFTAAAILKLELEKKLKITDLVTKFLPNFPYSNVTIKHLLTHTSGIPEYMDFPEKDFDKTLALTNLQLENYIESFQPKVISAPGVKFKYINTNYATLALIVEKVSKTPFEQYVKNEIWKPAGLVNVCFANQISAQKNIATGHLGNCNPVAFHFQNGVLGDKGVYSSVEEIYTWIKAYFIEFKVLPESVVQLAMQPQNQLIKGKPEELYGYGLRLDTENSFGKLVYHGGLWRGFHNNMVFRPHDQYIFIVLSNFRNRAHIGKNGLFLQIIDGV